MEYNKKKDKRPKPAAIPILLWVLGLSALIIGIAALIVGSVALSKCGSPPPNNVTDNGFEWNLPLYSFFPDPQLYAIASDYDLEPQPFPATVPNRYFLLSKNSTLINVRLRGNTTNYGSVNTIMNATAPISIPLYLYKNSLYVTTLLTIPASAVNFDLLSQGLNYVFTTNDDIAFIFDYSNVSSGQIGNFLFNVGFTENE